MRKLVISERAKKDIIEIRTYISEHNLSAAKKLIRTLNGSLKNLCHTPFMGSIRSEFHPQARCLVVDKYLVFYDVTEVIVYIRPLATVARTLAKMAVCRASERKCTFLVHSHRSTGKSDICSKS